MRDILQGDVMAKHYFRKNELLVLSLKIAVVEIFFEALIMFVVFPPLEGYITPFWENIIDPLLLVCFTIPTIAYWAILPYARQRNVVEERLGQLNDEIDVFYKAREKSLLDHKKELEIAIKQSTQKLGESEARYNFAVQATQDGLWDWHTQTDALYLSPRWFSIIGYDDNECPCDMLSWFARIHKDDREQATSSIMLSKDALHETKWECEYRMLNKNGHYIWVQTRWIVIKANRDDEARLVGSQSDISERKRLEEKLIYDALHDGLTGLSNRTLLLDRLTQTLLQFKRSPTKRFSLLFLDIDNFKHINDTFGHAFGDTLLKTVAQRMTGSVRSIDTVARLGGDEFAILLPEIQSQEDLQALLVRLMGNIKQPVEVRQGKTLTPTISIGVVVSKKHHQTATPQDIIVDADLALYDVKRTTKGTFSMFTLSMRNQISKQFDIEHSLKDALERDQIQLFYQPIVNAKLNQVAGFEALMRWNHPRHGWVSPAYFIPIAETSDVICALGVYAIEKATEQLKQLHFMFGRDDWYMSVNVSPGQLKKPGIVDLISSALQKNDLKGECLQIEITETTLMESSKKITSYLNQIKKLGVRLAIDDFGVGYSSLGTFSQYPFHTLKIDKSFVDNIASDGRSKKMIRLIQTLTESLSMRIVAEGVETKEQLDILLDMGCSYIQGFYFSKPLPVHELNQLLESALPPSQWHGARQVKETYVAVSQAAS